MIPQPPMLLLNFNPDYALAFRAFGVNWALDGFFGLAHGGVFYINQTAFINPK